PRNAPTGAAAAAASGAEQLQSDHFSASSTQTSSAINQSDSDRSKQADELEVMRSIFTDELREVAVPTPHCRTHSHLCCTHAMDLALGAGLTLEFCLPRDYPSEHPPQCRLCFSAEWDSFPASAASPTAVGSLLAELQSTQYDSSAPAEERECVLYQWAE